MRKSIAEEFINLVLQAVGSEFRVRDTGEGLSDDHPKPVNSGESASTHPISAPYSWPSRTPRVEDYLPPRALTRGIRWALLRIPQHSPNRFTRDHRCGNLDSGGGVSLGSSDDREASPGFFWGVQYRFVVAIPVLPLQTTEPGKRRAASNSVVVVMLACLLTMTTASISPWFPCNTSTASTTPYFPSGTATAAFSPCFSFLDVKTMGRSRIHWL